MLDILIARPDVEKIYALSSNAEINFLSRKVVKISVDFLSEHWEENLKRTVAHNMLHVVINNAGYLYKGDLEVTSQDEIQKMYRINYFGPLRIIQILLPNIKEGKAHLVNIGSMGGFSGSAKYPGLSVYSSTKAALANLSECWAEELKVYGVKSNCLALGAVDTEMLQNAFPGFKSEVSPELMASRIIDFAFNYSEVINGKILPLSLSNP
jgi:short-subunit dehydrogenase